MLDSPLRRPMSSSARSVALRPRATYRLQFHKDFPFSAGRDLAGYLSDLGISHLYCSPILTARAGSMHGYDVVDYDAISQELGGEAAFLDMAATLRRSGIGIILDIVPNHMAVGGADNKLWLNLLKFGRKSPYASWFDVDFDCPDPELNGKVHAPFLGRPYREVLAAGELKLIERPRTQGPTTASFEIGGYAIAYGEHLFPIRPEDDAEISAAGLDAFADPDRLDPLIRRQNFVLDWWRNAGDRINWRRFFDITQLAAIRMEEPAAFAAKHAVSLRLYRDGIIDGLRIDHVDGLGDPAAYCKELRRQLDELQPHRPKGLDAERAYVIVEKILASGEPIPADWDVDGSTGYDFMNEVSALQHDVGATARLGEHWAALTGRSRDFHAEEEIARHQILDFSFDGQRKRLVDILEGAGAEHRDGEGITRGALRRAVTSLIAELRAYRSYATGREDGEQAGERFDAALETALSAPLSDPPALRFVASVISGEGEEALRPLRIEAIRRFNQLSAPLAAKAVEDTAFYRYGRLLSRNDVGFDAEILGLETDAFHAIMQARASSVPRAMLATATHDHKRGEDVRARLAAISEIPDEFIAATQRWSGLNASIRPEILDTGDEYMAYQMIVGAWDFGLSAADASGLKAYAERLAAWARKSLREGKLRSGWAQPNEAYEQGYTDFVTALLSPDKSADFIADVSAFVDRIGPAGAANGLVQMTLRCTVPGLPDTYQGTEFWDFSLVDPDNRRPVDFAARQAGLKDLRSGQVPIERLATSWRDGRIKQAILDTLLTLRASQPGLFSDGEYEPLQVIGRRKRNVLAFLRRHEDKAALVVVTRLVADGLTRDTLVPDAAWWDDTTILGIPPTSESTSIVGSRAAVQSRMKVADAVLDLPVSVWLLGLS
jgi:(1->4)-alpha-D-glucan 1-alpha-D-glucosylmutase